jgi:ribosome-binding factor A
MSDEVLQNLVIVSVEPAPHTGRLLVTVAVPHSADVIGLTLAQTHLARATARIRLEVTQEIHRRKSPELVWFIMP